MNYFKYNGNMKGGFNYFCKKIKRLLRGENLDADNSSVNTKFEHSMALGLCIRTSEENS